MINIIETKKNVVFLESDRVFNVFHYKTLIAKVSNKEVTYLYLPSATSSRIAKKYITSILGEISATTWLEMKDNLKSGNI